MADASARYQSLEGQARVSQNLVYNPSSGKWELEQQAVIEAVTGNLYLAVDEVEAKLDSLLAELQLKADLTETQPISASSLPLPTGATTETTLALIKTAVEVIDNFISGTRGLVTEDNSASILAGVDDQLLDYSFSGWVVSGTAVYLGYEDKVGAYYVKYIETSTGVVTFAVGSGGIVAPGSYSGLSYGSFASKF